MKANNQRIFEIKERPLRQCERFLNWFNHIGVRSFDVHVRRYPNSIRHEESWVTCHDGIDKKRIIQLWKWMRYENMNDSDVYIRPHAPQDHPVIFLDDLCIDRAQKVARSYSSAVIQTSDNNTQVWVKTATPLSVSQRKQAQSELSRKSFTDRGSTSGDHFGRLCGMFSQKRKTWVNAIYFSTPHAYEPSFQAPTSPYRGRGACVLKRSDELKNMNSTSEAEFGWAIGMYKTGGTYEDVRSAICQSAKLRGKRNPEKYATLTAQKAAEIVNI